MILLFSLSGEEENETEGGEEMKEKIEGEDDDKEGKDEDEKDGKEDPNNKEEEGADEEVTINRKRLKYENLENLENYSHISLQVLMLNFTHKILRLAYM